MKALGRAATVLLVDDHEGFRRQARRLLEAGGYEVVAEAADATTARAAIARSRPDLVLLDIGLPDEDGLAVAESITAAERPPLVILVSSRDAAAYGSRIRSSGAVGFIPKEELCDAAIRGMLRGA